MPITALSTWNRLTLVEDVPDRMTLVGNVPHGTILDQYLQSGESRISTQSTTVSDVFAHGLSEHVAPTAVAAN